MAASFTTTATTIEGQALELAREIQELEAAYNVANPDTPIDNANIAIDVESLTCTITITLPVLITGTGNQLAIAADEYLD